MIDTHFLRKATGVAFLVLASATAAVASPPQRVGPASPEVATAERARDLRTPAGALRSFVEACRKGDYATAGERLNLDAIPPAERAAVGTRLAWQLQVVLDRKLAIPYELLSHEAAGRADDELPPDLERLGRVDGSEILLERTEDGESGKVWKFAAGTIEQIPALYERFGYGVLGEFLPAAMFEIRFLGLQLWQWIGLLLVVLLALPLSWLGASLVNRLLRPLVSRTETAVDDRILDNLLGPFRFVLAIALFALGSIGLSLSLAAYGVLGRVEIALIFAAVTWTALRTLDILVTIFEAHLEARKRRAVIAVLPLATKAAKVFLLIVAVVAMLQNLGFNVAGLIAGLGVGGLAVALAAQKSIANLFGGVSLIADQPVRVGDFCRFGDGKVGTVEDVGIRSTRIRTLDRTLVTIPNAEFSEIQLENYGLRDRIRLSAMIGLRYETSPDQLRHVLAEMRKLLIAHPMITDSPARIRFVGFGPHSLDLEIFAYVPTRDWDQFLRVREDILLRLMDIVQDSGTAFAFPSQTLYLGRDGGLDDEATRRAEEQVRGWRERNELPFPEFPEELVTRLDGTADYPPLGSASRRATGGGGAPGTPTGRS